jgi:hypothetical protein
MCNAYWIPKVPKTHAELQQWLHERAITLRYTLFRWDIPVCGEIYNLGIINRQAPAHCYLNKTINILFRVCLTVNYTKIVRYTLTA